MKLTFLGTRGQIDAENDRHRRHTATLIEYQSARVMIDCGADWLENIPTPAPHAIILTHAHPDHAFGLQRGAPCPVYATKTTWNLIDQYPIEQRHTVPADKPVEIHDIRFHPFPVEHSIRCPAVAYRVTAGRHTIFYAPDVAYIPDRGDAMDAADLYIGDGATADDKLIRRKGDRIFGHAAMRTQLTWCKKSAIPRAIFTHCGKHIVDGDEDAVLEQLRKWAAQRNVEVEIAHDGMERILH